MNIGNLNSNTAAFDSDDCLSLRTVRTRFRAWHDFADDIAPGADTSVGYDALEFVIDFSQLVEMGHIEGVQSVYFSRPLPPAMTLHVQGSGQVITPDGTRDNAAVPIFSPNPPVFILRVDPNKYEFPIDGSDMVPVYDEPYREDRDVTKTLKHYGSGGPEGRPEPFVIYEYFVDMIFTNRKVYAR